MSTIEIELLTGLASDPRIPDPDAIAVYADHGVVTLRGTVGSFAQRRAAVADARKIEGVEDVFDELNVRLETAETRGHARPMRTSAAPCCRRLI